MSRLLFTMQTDLTVWANQKQWWTDASAELIDRKTPDVFSVILTFQTEDVTRWRGCKMQDHYFCANSYLHFAVRIVCVIWFEKISGTKTEITGQNRIILPSKNNVVDIMFELQNDPIWAIESVQNIHFPSKNTTNLKLRA